MIPASGAVAPQMQGKSDEIKNFFVSHISNGKVTDDGNHPPAGKQPGDMVRILAVRDALPGEKRKSAIHASDSHQAVSDSISSSLPARMR